MYSARPTSQLGFLSFRVGLFIFASCLLSNQLRAQVVASAVTQQPPATLVQQAEITAQSSANGGITQAIALYKAAAVAFRKNGEYEAAALAWHRINRLAERGGLRQEAIEAKEKARMILRARTLPMTAFRETANAQAARAYLTLGRIQLESGEMKQALDSYQSGLYLAQNAKLSRETAAAHTALGLLASEGGEYKLAIEMTEASLEHWRAARDFNGEAMAMNNLARFFEKQKEFQLAAQMDEQVINIYRVNRNRKAEAGALQEALRLHLILGNYDASVAACEQLVGLAHANHDEVAEGNNLLTLALLETYRENFSAAYLLLLKSLIVSNQKNHSIRTQLNDLLQKIDALPKSKKQSYEREKIIEMAEFEANRKDFSAAYQLLLRALVMNDGKTEITDTMLNTRIKSLANQFSARQHKLAVTHP